MQTCSLRNTSGGMSKGLGGYGCAASRLAQSPLVLLRRSGHEARSNHGAKAVAIVPPRCIRPVVALVKYSFWSRNSPPQTLEGLSRVPFTTILERHV